MGVYSVVESLLQAVSHILAPSSYLPYPLLIPLLKLTLLIWVLLLVRFFACIGLRVERQRGEPGGVRGRALVLVTGDGPNLKLWDGSAARR